MFALHKEFSRGRGTAELHSSQYNIRPSTLSTKINVNHCENINWRSFFNLLRDGSHNGMLKVDVWKHYEKTPYMARCYDVGPVSFNETVTSTTCWCLHTYEKQISRWIVIHVLCHHIWWNVCVSSQPKIKQGNATWRTSWLPPQKKVHHSKFINKVVLLFFFFFFFWKMWYHLLTYGPIWWFRSKINFRSWSIDRFSKINFSISYDRSFHSLMIGFSIFFSQWKKNDFMALRAP